MIPVLNVFWRRLLIAYGVILLIYNPWFSLYQILIPADDFTVADLETYWPLKLLAIGVLGGLLIWFLRSTRDSMGWLGLIGVTFVLGLLSYLPFYFEWLLPTSHHIGNTLWFFFLPVILGFGMTSAFASRTLFATQITKPVIEDDHHHGGGHVVADHHSS